ncbi:MAG: glycerophosphodiester phosphodiesterase [Sphaerochaetaceae bacterium]
MKEPFLKPLPRVIAHRGDSKFYPENTIEAFLSAVEMGVDVIETDVHLTKDHKIVVSHDASLQRNTNGIGEIEERTLKELKKLDAGYNFSNDGGKSYPFRSKGVTLPTLEEVLEACPYQRFNIDLKSKNGAIVDVFEKAIRENRAVERVLCASFHLSHLKQMRKLNPQILTSVTTAEVLPLLLKQKLDILPKSLNIGRTLVFQVPIRQWAITVVNKKFVQEFHKRNAVIQVWTVNDEPTMRELFQLGVDSIMTDDPRTLIKVAKELNLL